APVEANEAQLGHVFLNLLLNAARAIPEGNPSREEVRVATRSDEAGDVIVEVSDTGAGIEPDVLPRIFDPFFTTRGAGKGVGLGLSVSHGIVKSLGGEMRVESAPGKGSLFRVVLRASQRWRRPSSSSMRVSAPAKCQMLVVDADPLLGDAMARALLDEAELT